MSAKLRGKSIVVRSADHLGAKAGDQTVLMSVRHGKYVGLDPIGSAIWSKIEKPVSVESLFTGLLAEYEAEPEILRRDVLKFLNEMHALGMIEVVT